MWMKLGGMSPFVHQPVAAASWSTAFVVSWRRECRRREEVGFRGDVGESECLLGVNALVGRVYSEQIDDTVHAFMTFGCAFSTQRPDCASILVNRN